MKQLLTATSSGEVHGLINTLTNANEFNDFKHMAPDIKAKVEKEKKEDAKIVRAKYINPKGRHERLTKPYCRYAGDPIQIWHLIPNQVYDLPMGFIKEVNAIRTPVRAGLVSLDGKEVTKGGAPLEHDQEGEQAHMLVPATF